MSDAIKEAMKECGLEELLNLGDFDLESSTGLNPDTSSQDMFSQEMRYHTPINTFNNHQVSQHVSTNIQPAKIIRLSSLPTQPQIISSSVPIITTQSHRPPPGVIRMGNVTRPIVCGTNSIITQHSLPSQNGRIIKLVPKVGPTPNNSGLFRTLVNSGSTINTVKPVVLNSVPIPQINTQTQNFIHINRQTLSTNSKPVVQLSTSNPNGVFRYSLQTPSVARHNATRPAMVRQNITLPPSGGNVLSTNIPANIPLRVIAPQNVHQLSQRPLKMLNQNIVPLNSSRLVSPVIPASTLNPMYIKSVSPTNHMLNLPDKLVTSYQSNGVKIFNPNSNLSTTPNAMSTGIKIDTTNTSVTSLLSNNSEAKTDISTNNITESDKQSNNNYEEKKPQTTDTDSGDIWAALSELAAFDGLNEEDLGKAEPTNSMKVERANEIKVEPASDIKEFSSNNHSVIENTHHLPYFPSRIPFIQKVVIGEKGIYSPRQDYFGGQRFTFQTHQMMNGIPRNFAPQRPNGQVPNLLPEIPIKDEEAEDELGHAETFSEYMPTKLKFGCKHPDPVVESASLSSVEAPDINYNLALPKCCWRDGLLSAVQLESITYSCQKHTTFLPSGERAGFLIGDGAGVGKGRIISGIIYENYLQGRKRALWLSVSNDLKVDAERDLNDIGATNIKVYSLNKFKYEKISSKDNGKVKSGVIFATYSSLVGQSKIHNKYKTRLQQLIKWLSKDPDSVIVFDECHKAKNLFSSANKKATKTSQKVLELQNKLKSARVVYASATGATEPRNLGYMVRLGLWGPGTPFTYFADFIQTLDKRGVGAMEIIAMEMKQRGTYIARQLSFKGVSFHVEDVDLAEDFVEMYNKSVLWWVDAREKFQYATTLVVLNNADSKKMWGQFWSSHQRFFKYLCISSKISHCVKLCNKAIKLGKTVVIGLQSTGESRMKDVVEKESDELDDFVSTAKEVLKNLVEKYFPCSNSTAADSCASSPKFNTNNKRLPDNDYLAPKKKKLKKNSDSSGDSDSSDDAAIASSDESDYNPFAKGSDYDSSEEKIPEKRKPKKKRKASSSEDETEELMEKWCDSFMKKGSNSAPETVDEALTIKRRLLRAVEKLGEDLPPNALDDLINQLGGPARVAEMTGRKGRLVSDNDGVVRYEKRNDIDSSLEAINLSEKQKFMDADKLIAIISEAASSGISLQADRRAMNQRRRVHITLELPWSADRAIQQFGRTHRSNQVSAPEYVFLISKLAGERRFASTVAKRLECLGALTHGDRRAAEARDLSQFNIDTKFGHTALDAVLKSVIGSENPLVHPFENESETEPFFEKVRPSLVGVGLLSRSSNNSYSIEKDSCNITKFLNRILGMQVNIQNSLFSYFNKTLGKVIMNAKKEGKWDLGILDIGSSGELVEEVRCEKFRIKVAEIHTSVVLHVISVDRGFGWEAAQKLLEKHTGSDDGIYKFSGAVVPGRLRYILAISKKDHKNQKWFEIYKPSNGKHPNLLSHSDLKSSYEKVLIPTDDVIKSWQFQYERSLEMCSHKYEKGYCKNNLNNPCEVGKRKRTYHVLSGSVLSVWTNMEHILSKNHKAKDGRLQVIRLRTSNNKRIVGVLINDNIMEPLMTTLNSGNAPPNQSFRAQFSSSTPNLFHSSGQSQANGSDWR